MLFVGSSPLVLDMRIKEWSNKKSRDALGETFKLSKVKDAISEMNLKFCWQLREVRSASKKKSVIKNPASFKLCKAAKKRQAFFP